MKFNHLALIALIGFLASCDSTDKLAEVNGETVSEKEFAAFLKLKQITPRDDDHRQGVLQNYLEREALAKVIEQQDLLNTELVDAEINEFKKEMLISRYFEKYIADAVSDEAVLNYYNSNPEDYQNKKVHVAHILFRTSQDMDESERRVKLTAAQEVHGKITSGEDFAELAQSYSEDKVSAKKGGDLGWLTQGSVDKRFSDKVFSLEEGEVSEPFETDFGFHVVKVIEGPTVVKQPFDSVKGRIRHQLRTQAKEAEMDRLLSEIEIEQ